jgi:hypothetical protein
MALPLGEDGHEHVGPRDLLTSGGLHVDDSPMDHALEAGRRLRLGWPRHLKSFELIVEIVRDAGSQSFEIDVASTHHICGVPVVDQCEKKVFERSVLVLPLVGVFKRSVERRFETL